MLGSFLLSKIFSLWILFLFSNGFGTFFCVICCCHHGHWTTFQFCNKSVHIFGCGLCASCCYGLLFPMCVCFFRAQMKAIHIPWEWWKEFYSWNHLKLRGMAFHYSKNFILKRRICSFVCIPSATPLLIDMSISRFDRYNKRVLRFSLLIQYHFTNCWLLRGRFSNGIKMTDCINRIEATVDGILPHRING